MQSPLKAKPLRNPGESVDRQVQNLLYDELLPYYVVAMFLVLMAALEWLKDLTGAPPYPWTYTVMAAIAVALAARKLRRGFRQLENLKLGRAGEKAVGQYLERLREEGAEVFHDIPGEGFNLDHVVIHETGVYVIETKTLSKPDRGEAMLLFDGETVSRHGLKPDRNPITQVRAARRWLLELLEESTGKKFPIRAVVVYPGWYIEPTAEAKASDVWVLNPKALPAFISHSTVRLMADDVKLCAFHLGRYIRSVKD